MASGDVGDVGGCGRWLKSAAGVQARSAIVTVPIGARASAAVRMSAFSMCPTIFGDRRGSCQSAAREGVCASHAKARGGGRGRGRGGRRRVWSRDSRWQRLERLFRFVEDAGLGEQQSFQQLGGTGAGQIAIEGLGGRRVDDAEARVRRGRRGGANGASGVSAVTCH